MKKKYQYHRGKILNQHQSSKTKETRKDSNKVNKDLANYIAPWRRFNTIKLRKGFQLFLQFNLMTFLQL